MILKPSSSANIFNPLTDSVSILEMAKVDKENNTPVYTIKNTSLSHKLCPTAKRNKTDAKRDRKWTMVHGYFAVMGGFSLNVSDELIVKDGAKAHTTVTDEGILLLRKYDLLPDVSKSAIRARGKTDQLSKILICIQVSWMLIQTLARKIYRLPITLLEINVLAHIASALVIYAIWWYKPQGVEEPITIDLSECELCNQILKDNDFDNKYVSSEAGNDRINGKNTLSVWKKNGSLKVTLFLSFVSLVYSGIHLSAWNSHFPTTIEQKMWRGASCVLLIIAVLAIFWILIHDIKDDVIFLLLQAIYIIARIILLVEVFLSFRSLPLGAYSTPSWIGYFPHIS